MVGVQVAEPDSIAAVAPVERDGPSPIQTSLAKLAKREAEVLRCIAGGQSAPQIASVLNISVYTVRTYIRNILSKLNARTVAHAVARGFEVGELRLAAFTGRIHETEVKRCNRFELGERTPTVSRARSAPKN